MSKRSKQKTNQKLKQKINKKRALARERSKTTKTDIRNRLLVDAMSSAGMDEFKRIHLGD